MKKSLIYFIHVLGLVLVFKVKAYGQTAYELQCKSQAKEVALQTYQTCVTENRQQQIDTVRKEYQLKLNELKEHYNQELKKAAGKDAAIKESAAPKTTDSDEASIQLRPVKRASAAPAKMGKAEKPVKGVAKNLPRKQNNNGPALSTKTVSEDAAVVPAYEEASIEKEAALMDSDSNEATEPTQSY